ncbi:hypothetical protein VOLCADRAFT_90394 [Volvox carteri f. nagariensis]|uniref:Uncharacterized protein n=1 Tax=Volvox carteri f. nagariensis TaxID=3068 RepID=D8TU92_VOLCA|nr:uncharacterized protein VOLCADRAFT_90394 [Volvox carteri f. nagariensis]EFJ48996.1 hypothetical protein VOLCADRAFT_90394 [Volvox carteri f. nagariensis]|eukprot:XP_002949893.1 hypothetical protein VOLCADRAFT_90394 [Volvox carteri f. nagariensis]
MRIHGRHPLASSGAVPAVDLPRVYRRKTVPRRRSDVFLLSIGSPRGWRCCEDGGTAGWWHGRMVARQTTLLTTQQGQARVRGTAGSHIVIPCCSDEEAKSSNTSAITTTASSPNASTRRSTRPARTSKKPSRQPNAAAASAVTAAAVAAEAGQTAASAPPPRQPGPPPATAAAGTTASSMDPTLPLTSGGGAGGVANTPAVAAAAAAPPLEPLHDVIVNGNGNYSQRPAQSQFGAQGKERAVQDVGEKGCDDNGDDEFSSLTAMLVLQGRAASTAVEEEPAGLAAKAAGITEVAEMTAEAGGTAMAEAAGIALQQPPRGPGRVDHQQPQQQPAEAAAGATLEPDLARRDSDSDAAGEGQPSALPLLLGSSAGVTAVAAAESDSDEGPDDTAVAISVLAAAAAAAAAADAAAGHHSFPRGGTWRRRRTSTWEVRPPARRPPRVVAFQVGGGLQELQALVNSVVEPTIIDLQGAVIALAPSPSAAVAAAAPAVAEMEGGEPLRGGPTGEMLAAAAAAPPPPPPPPPATTTALVSASALRVPGWSALADLVPERAKMLSWERATQHQQDKKQLQQQQQQQQKSSISPPPPPRQGGGMLLLHRDDVTIANGTLQLHRGCVLAVTGRRVALRRVEVVDAEAAAWWRQATAMPATSLQSAALISVTSSPSQPPLQPPPPPPPPQTSSASPHAASNSHEELTASVAVYDTASGGGPPSLELDDCSIIATGRDRDLIRVDGGNSSSGGGAAAAAVTARYSRFRGGANAAVVTLHSTLSLDCCELEGYAAAGVVALGSSTTVRLVGSRLLGGVGVGGEGGVGLLAAAGSRVSAVGCFLRGHAANVECSTSSSVDLQGCVLSRTGCRYGVTLHSAGAAAATVAAGGKSSDAAAAAAAELSRVRLTDCELAHAVQVGGGELELERCTFALRPAPSDLPAPSVQITSDPALAAKLAAAVAATSLGGGGGGGAGGSSGGVRGAVWTAYAGSVAAVAALRVVECRTAAGGGGEPEAVVLEAAEAANVYISSSPGVVIRRLGGGGTGGSGSGSGSGVTSSPRLRP